MTPITCPITHHYQPTNTSCSQASLAMLLSVYDDTITPEKIIEVVPVGKDETGEEIGTIAQDLATWCIQRGYTVTMYTSDCEIIDTNWKNLPREALLERMQRARSKRNVTSLGKSYSKQYVQSYIDFVEAGGKLHILPFISSKLIYSLLEKGPFTVAVSFRTLWGQGHNKSTGLRTMEPHDLGKGNGTTHSIVVYGNTASGDILVADPWVEPGFHTVNIEQLITAIATAQIACDNLLFQLEK